MKKLTGYAAAMLMAAGAAWAAGPSVIVRIDNADALRPLSEASVDAYRKSNPGAVIAANASGTGGSLRALCGGKTDIAGTTRPMARQEIDACAQAHIEFIELPIAFDAVAVVTHASNDFAKSLSVDDLRRIWSVSAQGKLKRWNQINPAWPDLPLILLAPDILSDDADYFNQAVLGKQVSRHDYMMSSEDGMLVEGIARSSYTLGYVSLASYLKNRTRLQAVPIAPQADGTPVMPSSDTVASGSYKPLSRPLFLYVAVKSLARPEVKSYVEFFLANGARIAKSAGYAALDDASYKASLGRVQKQAKGTAWGGSIPVGMTIGDVQKKYGAL